MNHLECDSLINSYVSWLKAGLSAECLDTACELTTPFLDRHNDHIQVYAEPRGDEIVLSDDGYVLADLRTSGLEFTTEKRKAVLDATLNGYGVRLEEGRLTTDADQRNVGQRMHGLIQAMLAVNDMFMMAQPRVAGFFWEDVRDFLESHDVRFASRIKLTGKSGFDHGIDFLIPRSKERPERIVQVINAPSKNSIGAYLFSLSDTREARPQGSEAYAALNDQGRSVGADVVDALKAYNVRPIPWTKRDEYVELLAS